MGLHLRPISYRFRKNKPINQPDSKPANSSLINIVFLLAVAGAHDCKYLAFHLLKYGQDHFKGRSLAGILVHADPDELGDVRRDAGPDADAEALEGYLHAALHG